MPVPISLQDGIEVSPSPDSMRGDTTTSPSSQATRRPSKAATSPVPAMSSCIRTLDRG